MDYKLRPWKMDDLDSLVRYANNRNISRFLTDRFPHPYTDEDARNFIEMATSESHGNIFAIEVQGEAAGSIGIHPLQDIFRENAELGYWLAEPYWGQGIITRAVREMVHFAFDHYDIRRVFARPFGNNPASQKVLEKAGFILEARFEKSLIKNGERLDELVFAIRRETL
ncbi:MAG: GNAT family protein [Bacteroidales bacterium]